MISLTLENKNRMIQFCCDEQGLNELIAKLHKLKEVGQPAWGKAHLDGGGSLKDLKT